MSEVKAGFPPKILSRPDEDTLADCGIKDGEQLTADGAGGSSVSSISGTSASSTSAAVQSVAKPSVATLSSTSAPSAATEDETIPFGEGFLVPRIQEDDNSCLFRSVGYVCLNNAERHADLRKSGSLVTSFKVYIES
jgi:ubiquitin thioesterase OTU1